jgi:ankyrin repeat protein
MNYQRVPRNQPAIAGVDRIKKFFYAVEKGNRDEVVRLLTPDLINKVIIVKDEWRTPLIMAARRGSHDVALDLIVQGAEVDYKDSRGSTAIIHAVLNHQLKIACLLASHGADIWHKDAFERSAHDALVTVFDKLELRKAAQSFEYRDKK